MRKIILFVTLMACIATSKAQLTNTKWVGKMIIPEEVDVYLKFTKDTVQLILKNEGFVGETMQYAVKDSVITFKKISGNSPCNADPFTVTYAIKDNKLMIKPLLDACPERVNSWTNKPFDKTEFK